MPPVDLRDRSTIRPFVPGVGALAHVQGCGYPRLSLISACLWHGGTGRRERWTEGHAFRPQLLVQPSLGVLETRHAFGRKLAIMRVRRSGRRRRCAAVPRVVVSDAA